MNSYQRKLVVISLQVLTVYMVTALGAWTEY